MEVLARRELPVNDQWKARFGVAFDQTPVTQRPTVRLPDSDRWWACVGGEYKWTPNLKFDAGFVYIFADSPSFNQNQGSTAGNGWSTEPTTRACGSSRCRRRTRSNRQYATLVTTAGATRPSFRGRAFPAARLVSDESASCVASASLCFLQRPLRPPHVISLIVRKAAVLGAGVMGAQIAAHFANAGIPGRAVRPARQGRRSRRPRCQSDRGSREASSRRRLPQGARAAIEPCQLRQPISRAWRECDLVIEAIAERLDWKRDLYAKVAPHLAPARDPRVQHVGAVARGARRRRCRKTLRPRFCGMHFFNPPRYMHLVELVAAPPPTPRCSTHWRRSSRRRSARA